jgi:hypothetical protein
MFANAAKTEDLLHPNPEDHDVGALAKKAIGWQQSPAPLTGGLYPFNTSLRGQAGSAHPR